MRKLLIVDFRLMIVSHRIIRKKINDLQSEIYNRKGES